MITYKYYKIWWSSEQILYYRVTPEETIDILKQGEWKRTEWNNLQHLREHVFKEEIISHNKLMDELVLGALEL